MIKNKIYYYYKMDTKGTNVNEWNDTDSQLLTTIQKDPEKKFNDDELDLVTDLRHEGMQFDKIIEKILEERKKNKE